MTILLTIGYWACVVVGVLMLVWLAVVVVKR